MGLFEPYYHAEGWRSVRTSRRIPSLSVWPDLAFEAILRFGGGLTRRKELSWDVPPQVLDRVKVRWPKAYQWHHTPRWGDQILDLLRRRLDVVITDVPQNYKGTVGCEFVIDGRVHKVAFNVSDYPDFVDQECTRESLVTFKFQYREGGYADRRIVPGGYLPGSKKIYDFLPYLRWCKNHQPPRFEVYGRFSMDFSPGVRGEALRLMQEATEFQFHGGNSLVRYSRYLREVARSRICLDLPGQGPLCFRLVEYLAIGSCIVAYEHGVALPASLMNNVHLVYCQKPPEILEYCRELVNDPVQQRALAKGARDFFDRYLHRDQLCAYYLSVVLAAAEAS